MIFEREEKVLIKQKWERVEEGKSPSQINEKFCLQRIFSVYERGPSCLTSKQKEISLETALILETVCEKPLNINYVSF